MWCALLERSTRDVLWQCRPVSVRRIMTAVFLRMPMRRLHLLGPDRHQNAERSHN